MSTAITKAASSSLAAGGLSRAQIELLKKTICKGASDDELALFLEVCKAKRLDPFSGQIHAVKRKEWNAATREYIEKMTYQTGIDGFRVMAERTGERDGEDEAEWCGEDGVWKTLWTSKEPPFAARVRVYRKGTSRPYTGLATWSFYVQTFTKDGVTKPNRMWERGGPHMLAKCAEALAWRKAFPDQLADVYAHEEMAQAENERTAPTAGLQAPEVLPAPTATGRLEAPQPEGPTMVDLIAAATTVEELTGLAQRIGKRPPTDPIRGIYKARKAALQKAEEEALAAAAKAAARDDAATGDGPPPDDGFDEEVA